MTSTTTLRQLLTLTTARRALTTALTGVAFWNSYHHTTQWFADHGQAPQANALAAIPEAAIILVLLTLAQGGMSKAVTRIVSTIGIGSVAITLTANLEGAAPGAMGVAAALVAPVFAILGFGLEIVSLIDEASRKAEQLAAGSPPVRRRRTTPTPATKAAATSLTDKGILWATEITAKGAPWPTTAEILTQFPNISRTTAGRIHKACPWPVVNS